MHSEEEIVIDAKNISKRYRVGAKDEQLDTFASQFAKMMKAPVENFRRLKKLKKFDEDDTNVHWALKDLSFKVRKGEVLGVIGHNGAGKSTLLKLLSHITEPTSGNIKIKGRVSALLEVGTGFHEELTGRDNIYMNGTILGMTKKEIDAKFDEIVAFSGVEKYIDTPVKFYSSGMKVRLGFSVAAHLEPEILIIDEVLAVGDITFQKKCLGRMENVASHGRTVIFVSHDMSAVQSLCPKTMLLTDGKIKMIDRTPKVIKHYLSSNTLEKNSYDLRRNSKVNQLVTLEDIKTSTTKNGHQKSLVSGKEAFITLHIKNLSKYSHNARVDLAIENQMGKRVCWMSTELKQIERFEGDMLTFRIKRLPLNAGQYSITFYTEVNNEPADWIRNFYTFQVAPGNFYSSGKMPSQDNTDILIDYEII